MDLRPGDAVFGQNTNEKYEIIRVIDGGGFGIVCEAKGEDGETIALKTITTALLNDTGLEALTNEGHLATEVRHENVLRVIYFHDGEKYPHLPPYMLMEYADGGTLSALLNERRSTNALLDSSELREIFIQLASGMEAINERLVHRDIKPDNILIVNNRLKISDFGLSKVVGAATRSRTFKGINHVMYCAPEAWRLDKNLPSMDMYSMGITFYEIATLHHPYEVSENGNAIEAWMNAHFSQLPISPNQFNKSLDARLAQIIIKMISKRPEDRYTSWDELIQRLKSDEEQKPQRRNVSSLIERAMATHRATEEARLIAESERRKEEEQRELFHYCFKEVVDAATETVETFNSESEFIKLRIKGRGMGFSIYADKGAGALPTVSAEMVLARNIPLRDGQIVKAWGTVKAPSGQGFNLLLVARGNDDLYGHWQTLHVSHSPIAVRRDQRPEPFPFEIGELPKEVRLLNAMHIYQTTKGMFQADMLDPLLAELLDD